MRIRFGDKVSSSACPGRGVPGIPRPRSGHEETTARTADEHDGPLWTVFDTQRQQAGICPFRTDSRRIDGFAYASRRLSRTAAAIRATATYTQNTANPVHGASMAASGRTVTSAWPALLGRYGTMCGAQLSGSA